MNLPNGPFLELSFYFVDRPETAALADFIYLLVELGGECTGEIAVHVGEGIRDQPFTWITEPILEKRPIADLNDLVQQFAAPNQKVIQVYMNNATGIFSDLSEILTYLSISPSATQQDHHPLSIWTEGWMFSGPPDFLAEHAEYATQVGYQIYQRFRTLVERLSPSYAAIMIEQALPCLTDLRDNSSYYLFSYFFVNSSFVGEQHLKQIQEIYGGAYLEQLSNGLYVSSYEYFNPEHKSLPLALVLENSTKLAKLITSMNQNK